MFTCERKVIKKIPLKIEESIRNLCPTYIHSQKPQKPGLQIGIKFFLLNLTPNTSAERHLQKVDPCRHPCHTLKTY